MGKLNINGGGVDTNKKMADIDERFGPYTSKEAADAALGGQGRNTITAGLTVGILTANAGVKEYWYQPNKKSGVLELIPKGGNAADSPTEGNFASFDANGNLVDSGCNEGTFIKGVQKNGDDLTPDADGKVNVTVEDGKSAYELYVDEYKEAHSGSTEGMLEEDEWLDSLDAYGVYVKNTTDNPVMTRGEWLKYIRGKSAREIYNQEKGTSYDDAGFIEAIKSNYPMKYVEYDSNAYGASNPSSISNITPGATTEGKLWFMPNNDNTETKLFITVNNGTADEPDYDWYNMGVIDVPSNVLTEEMVDNDCTNGATGEPASAKAVMDLKAKLEGVTASEVKVSGYDNGFVSGGIACKNTTGSVQRTKGHFYYYSTVKTIFLSLEDIKRIRFSGTTVPLDTYWLGYAFLNIANFEEFLQLLPTEGNTGVDLNNYIVNAIPFEVSSPTQLVEIKPSSIPNEANYVALVYGSAEVTQSNFYCYLQSGESVVDLMPKIVNNLEEGGADKALSAEQGKILNDVLFEDAVIETYSLFSGYILTDGNEEQYGSRYWRYRWSGNNSIHERMTRIPISKEVTKITITASDEGTRIGFIKSGGATYYSSQNEYNTVFLSEGTELYLIDPGKTMTFDVPSDANFLYVRLGRIDQSLKFKPKQIVFSVNKIEENNKIAHIIAEQEIGAFSKVINKKVALSNIPLRKVDGWQGATTLQEQFAIEKADRLVNCKWTPKTGGICWSRRNSGEINYYDPIEYQGIPYSSNTDHAKWLGTHVSLYTFLTAVNNKYSLLYTECVKDGYYASAWGYEYHSSNGSTYYGTVCCGFTSYCTNGNVVYNNDQFWQRDDAFIIIQLHNQEGYKFNLDLLRVGDVLNNGGHSFLIYDLFVENGHVTQIKAKQATSGVVSNIARGATYRENENGYDPFTNPVGAPDVDNFDHFRFKEFETNTCFKPFDIDVYDENGDVSIDYNDDICPIAGDKCTFAVGQVVALNFNTNDSNAFPYTHIALKKDNETQNNYAISEIDTSELDPSQIGHAIKFANLAEGKYTAWCYYNYEGKTYNSAACSFIIVGTNDFDYNINEDGIRITLKNTVYRITNIGMQGIKNGYYVPSQLEQEYVLASGEEIANLKPQSVLIPKKLIENFDPTANYTLGWIDIMTEFGIQRLKNVPLFDQEGE